MERCRAIVARLLPPYKARHLSPGLRCRIASVERVRPSQWIGLGVARSSKDIWSDDELAAVLGHELAHYTHEHGRRQFTKGLWVQAVAEASGAAISSMNAGARQTADSTHSNSRWALGGSTTVANTRTRQIESGSATRPKPAMTCVR